MVWLLLCLTFRVEYARESNKPGGHAIVRSNLYISNQVSGDVGLYMFNSGWLYPGSQTELRLTLVYIVLSAVVLLANLGLDILRFTGAKQYVGWYETRRQHHIKF